ncbi:radical SAM additional 4Fe4S-binding SPASM domain-containing protein [Intestinibacter bartlettii DSM 16795]|uniref:radical SAM/SPASM domain-containing protein n=1 Tax=Intestinibacter bartlettii TaxID=261299 RepID=UPI000163120D|nr:radical SAM protein [Intestinibacter bartlettii]EDQ95635.1 radical SAM domain protein [Intestinibacter bartlettii DSM 16795]UWO80585.1 radical SAM protein [Intestinibacter bartlettii]SKA58697.1 radical SAM additional 4Fe4S-binding SPASM domain-containing protein [Intestinibacter bartlettii DSM 16795]
MNVKTVEPLIATYLSDKAVKNKIPLSGTFELSPICNMDCKMCYVKMTKSEVDKVGRLRTVEEWISIAEEAKDAGMLFLLITGGEPLLYKGFKELYLKLVKMGLIISINTNATLIDEEMADFFAKYPPSRLNITLYGGSNETYERLCGNPNGFTQVTRAIKYLKERNISVKLNASITPYNKDDIELIYKFAEKNELYVQFGCYMFPPVRRDSSAIGKGDRFSTSEAAFYSVQIDKLRMEKETFIKRAKAMKEGIVLKNDDPMDEQCEKIEGDPIGCRAGKSSFWLSWDGKIYPCGMMNSIASNPFDIGFINSWNIILEETKKIRLYSGCTDCKYKGICSSCAASIYTETGSFDKKPQYLCDMYSKVVEFTQLEYNNIIGRK